MGITKDRPSDEDYNATTQENELYFEINGLTPNVLESSSSSSDELSSPEAREPHFRSTGSYVSPVNRCLGSEELPRNCCFASLALVTLGVLVFCSWSLFDTHGHEPHRLETVQQDPPAPLPQEATQKPVPLQRSSLLKMNHPLGMPSPEGFPTHPPTEMSMVSSIKARADPTAKEPQCDYTETFACPAWGLFRNPNLRTVLTNNIMKANPKLIRDTDLKIVQDIVKMGLRNVSMELEIRAPAFATEVHLVLVTEASRDAVLDVMQLMSAPTVQGLGRDVAKLIRACPTDRMAYLRWYLEDKLVPRYEEIQMMASKVIPTPVRKLWVDRGYEWDITLDKRNIQVMRKNNFRSPSNFSAVGYDVKYYAIYAGLLEECRVLLDLLKMIIHELREEWNTSLHDLIDVLFQGISVPADSNSIGFMDALLWPLKCGAQGIDTLKSSCSPGWGRA